MAIPQTVAATLVRLTSGIRPLPESALPPPPFVVFANHSSHLDFAVIWAALPERVRTFVLPVAGRDYWERTRVRRWLVRDVFRAVLIERQRVTVATNPLARMLAALDAGNSLIVFPEGTRSATGAMQAFKPGLFHIAHARPNVPLVPAHLDNLNRILPKGDFIAVPLIASIQIGAPITLAPDESKAAFLDRAFHAVSSLQRN